MSLSDVCSFLKKKLIWKSSEFVAFFPGLAAVGQLVSVLRSATRRAREYRSTCATGRWLWSRWRPCSPAASEGRSQREVGGSPPARTRRCAASTHVAQEPDHAVGPAHAHQHHLVAEEDLQGHEDQDLAGAADHLVPHSEQKASARHVSLNASALVSESDGPLQAGLWEAAGEAAPEPERVGQLGQRSDGPQVAQQSRLLLAQVMFQTLGLQPEAQVSADASNTKPWRFGKNSPGGGASLQTWSGTG